MLVYAWQWRDFLPARKLWLAVYAILSTSIWASTICLRQHWVADVMAGWLLGGLVVVLAPRIAACRLCQRRDLPVSERWTAG